MRTPAHRDTARVARDVLAAAQAVNLEGWRRAVARAGVLARRSADADPDAQERLELLGAVAAELRRLPTPAADETVAGEVCLRLLRHAAAF
ncbi:MAG: hypothetical protein KIT09_19475 [Bryobacteraceae bacterium]|nr:hypothetical protein [Bryobacteraceae bacterium]